MAYEILNVRLHGGSVKDDESRVYENEMVVEEWTINKNLLSTMEL